MANLKLGKTIPIGNGEAGYYFNNLVLEAVDYGVCVVFPASKLNYSKFLVISYLTSTLGSQTQL